MPGGPLSDVQASVPYFRHVDEGEVQGSSKHGYLHGSVSGPETPNTSVHPPKLPDDKLGQPVATQKSFDPSVGRKRQAGDSKRRSWDGAYEPQIKQPFEPKWVPSGAPAGAPGHAGRSSPQRKSADRGNLRTSQGWDDSGGAEMFQQSAAAAAAEEEDDVMASYNSLAPSEVAPPPAVPDSLAAKTAAGASALLEAARGSRPRDEGQDLEHLDEEFYARLSKLRDDHQRNLNEISQLYESSVQAEAGQLPAPQLEPQPQPQEMAAGPMDAAEAADEPQEDTRPWWQRDDKDYGEVLRRLKALDIPLPPGAGAGGGGRYAPSADTLDAEKDKRALYSWSAEGPPGGEGADSPWGARGKTTRRPSSAPRARPKDKDKDWMARTTVPEPFKFDSRPSRPSIMAERTSFDLEVKRRLDEAECSTRFRAEPIPPTTMLPLYEKQEREKEAVRAKRVADRFQKLQEDSCPPDCYYNKPTPEPTIEKPPPFKAKPVPPSTKRSLMQSFEVDRVMRAERVKQRADKTFAEAKLPDRQQAHKDKLEREAEEMAKDPRAAELEDARRRMRERKIGVQRYPYKPKITKKMPDYHKKQRDFENNLKARKEELKAQVEATAPKPFRIHDSEPNLDKVHHDIMRDESLLPENRWPYLSSRLKGHSEPPPPKEDKPRRYWKPTKSFTAREIEVKKKRLEQMVAARSQLNEARERQEKQEEMNHMVSHALKDFEVERDKRNKREQERIAQKAADFKDLTKTYNKQLAEMNKRVSRRAMLFEQATQENLKRQVLEKFDETLVNEGVGYLAETD